jgi:hypothetical protein
LRADHLLASVLREAANGRFPDYDSAVEVMPALDGFAGAIFGFTGHSIITTNLDEGEVRAHLPSDDPGAPMNPAFIAWLAQRLNAHSYTPDIVLSAFRADPDPTVSLIERPDLLSHPRALMAKVFRRDVRAYSDPQGDDLLTMGHGVCDRIEVSVEVDPASAIRDSEEDWLWLGVLWYATKSLSGPKSLLATPHHFGRFSLRDTCL